MAEQIDRLEIQIEAQASKANQELDELIKKLGKVSSSITNIGGKNIGFSNMISQEAKAATTTKTFSSNLNSYSNSAKNARNSTKSLVSSIGMFYASCFLAIRAVKSLGRAVESSMDFLETSNYFEVAFGKIGGDAAAEWQKAGKENAEAYAQSFSERAKELTAKMTGYIIDESGNAMSSGMKNLGLNPDDVMQWQAVYAQMTDSLGIAEESTLRFSKALTMLGTDWASLRNISLDTSWNKFASALAGQSRAVRSLGIDVTQTTLQEYALEYGITKSVMAMNQAEKAQLRLLAMLRQSEVAFGDLANTIGSPSNQLRILEQNFANLARSIGNLFLPIVTKVLPYINGLVIALQRLFQWVGALLGIKFSSINSAMGGMDDSMGDFVGGAEDAGDALDKANAAAKKLKSTVLGIDELNINAPQEASGSGGASGAGGGSPVLDDAIAKALEDYEKKWDDAFNRMENKAQEFADKITAVAQYVGSNLKAGFDMAYVSDKGEDLLKNIQSIHDRIVEIFSDQDVSGAIKKAMDTSIQAIGSTVGMFASVATSVGYGITAGIDKGLEESEPYIKKKTISIANNITSLNEKIIDFNKGIAIIGTAFEGEGFQKIITFFTKLSIYAKGKMWDTLTGVISDVFGFFSKPISGNAEKWKKLLENLFDLASNLLGPFEDILDFLMENSVAYQNSFLHQFLTALTDIRTENVGNLLDMLNGGIETLINLTENFDLSQLLSPFSFLDDEVKNVVTNIENWFKELPGKIWSSISSSIEVIKQWASNIYSNVSNSIPQIIDDISLWWDELPENIGYALGLAFGKIIAWPAEIYNNLSTAIPNIIKNIKIWWDEFPEKFGESLSATKGKVSEWSEEIKVAFQEKITEIKDFVKFLFVDLPLKAFEAIITFKDKIIEWKDLAIASFKTEIPKIITTATTEFKALITNIKDIGKDMIAGLIEGAQEKWSELKETVTEFCNGVISGFKEGFDIHSPSKKMEEIGNYLLAGLGLSFEKDTISSSILEFTQSIIELFQQQLGYEQFYLIGQNMVLGLKTAWQELILWWNEESMPLWFEESVSPWFSEEKWMEVTDGMKLGIEGKWAEFAEQWQANIAKWWSTDVTPWFSLAKWQMFGENMKNGLYLGFEGIAQSIAGILNSLTNVFEYSMNQIVDAVNDFVKDYNEAAGIMGTDKLERFSHFSFADIPKYEAGGFPEDGLFFANHTELVGEFTNGRTAVANNDMITAGIEEAAYRGFSRAYSENDREVSLLEELIEAVREGRSISIDGRELISVYDDRKRRNGYQFT